MEQGGIVPHNTNLGFESFMDMDYMDELLLDGCWLEANASEFSQTFIDALTPISPFEPSFTWPNLEESSGSPSKDNRDERQTSSFPENLSISRSQGPLHYRKPQFHVENINSFVGSSNYSESFPAEQSKRWWIDPRAPTTVMDRLIRALSYIKDCSRDSNVLIQVWVPVNREGKSVLTTNNQPFSLDLNCPRLAHYREISVNYQFPADRDSQEDVLGLPGRVFRSKVPEWTPDVRLFTKDEYSRVGHAQQYDVRGTLAVPVMERGSRTCLGVIEVVLTTQKIKYRPELESVCKALEAVDLEGSEVSSSETVTTCDLSYQAVLPEILQVLRSACETHGLPLAQTWVSCIAQGKGGCRHSEENFRNCVSPIESACYIGDHNIHGFHEACSEYHLLKDQGIVGQAFKSNQPCFAPDVTACSKTEYPLSHHAKMFGLKSAVAIRLRSTSTGSTDFVLEFFLPVMCNDLADQRKMLGSLSDIIQHACRTLRVVTDKELREEWSSEEAKSDEPNSNSREGVTSATDPSTSGDGNSLNRNKTGEKKRVKAENTITLQVLRQHFAGSLKDAAKNLGVCPTTLKRVCRQYGIQRWPSRKIKKVGHSLQKIQRVIDSVQGTSGALQIESFYSNFPELASPDASRTTEFPNSKLVDHDSQPQWGLVNPPAVGSVSPSSSGSQNSTSSQCCSSGTQPNLHPIVANLEDNQMVKEEFSEGALRRATSEVNLHFPSNEPKLLPRSQSRISLSGRSEIENSPLAAECSGQKYKEREGPRIKVSYGEDTIRFRMQSSWRYKDLLEEISRRFGVNDPTGYHLKYLDDDAEWVLLTCDADLEECNDVYRASPSHTIKLAFVRDFQSPHGRSSPFTGGSL